MTSLEKKVKEFMYHWADYLEESSESLQECADDDESLEYEKKRKKITDDLKGMIK